MPAPTTELLDPNSILTLLTKMKGELEAALPRHITPDRMTRLALTALRMNPKLFRSTRDSFLGSLLTASALGLEPGLLGRSFLVPYFNKKQGVYICQFIPGWRGHLDLVSRAGKAAAWTGAVYDGDEFEWGLGDRPFVRQKEGKWHGENKALMYTYACGRQNGIDWPNVEVWPIEKVWHHRDKYNRVGQEHYSYRDPEMYARKIPLLQVIKYLPASIEMVIAQTLDVMGAEGRQRLTIDMALKGDIGDESQESTEVERIMESLDWEPSKRDQFRDAYEGRPKEALEFLTDMQAKAGQATQKQQPKQEGISNIKPEPAKQQDPPKQEPKKQEQEVSKKAPGLDADWFNS